jgi:FtsH-binding integral membrane protein
MNILEIYLLAGLIVIGISLLGIVVEKDAKRSRGAIAQFIFGCLLVILFLLGGGRFII